MSVREEGRRGVARRLRDSKPLNVRDVAVSVSMSSYRQWHD